jgi:Tfp pilus assembly pilus retraction ATPase PilT
MAHSVNREMCDNLLLWAVGRHNVSDIVFSAEDPAWIQKDGVWHVCSDLPFTRAECDDFVNSFTGQAHQAGHVRAGNSIDFAYSIHVDRGLMQRFRVNVTNSNKGAYIVMRALPTKLPVLEDLGLEPGILANLYPPSGLVIVSGVMGSGKSTILAGVIHTAILHLGRQILTLEHPIEFDFSSIPYGKRSAPITQSGIGQHVESWAEGVRSMTRRKGEIVMVGEARDKETLEAMMSAVEQGVTAYSTVHAQDVPQTFTKIVNCFPEEERPAVASVLKANLRLLLHQRLVERINRTDEEKRRGVPGRVALREFLVFDEPIRRRLYQVSYAELIPFLREMVGRRGQSLLQDAEKKFRRGQISDETFEAVRHEQEVNKAA